MLGIPRRYSHFVFGLIQSGLTSAIASAIASLPVRSTGYFAMHWLQSWLVSWLLMLPVVVFCSSNDPPLGIRCNPRVSRPVSVFVTCDVRDQTDRLPG
jgi:Protein of unknown function (DUF2798)